MKTRLKLSIVALSLVAMATAIHTQNVNAAQQQVSVKITWSGDNCEWADYNLGSFTAKETAQNMTATWKKLKCTLLSSVSWHVNISLTSDLTSDNWRISSWNIFLSMPARTVTGTLGTWTNNLVAAVSNHALSQSKAFYYKDANKVWVVEAIVTLSGTIPAWTAIGTYTTQINADLPNNS